MAYIKKSEVMKICEDYSTHCFNSNDSNGQDIADRILDDVVEIPTADIEVVRHGEWLQNSVKMGIYGKDGSENAFFLGYKCSLCGRAELYKEPYCNCGAKMDGGKAE